MPRATNFSGCRPVSGPNTEATETEHSYHSCDIRFSSASRRLLCGTVLSEVAAGCEFHATVPDLGDLLLRPTHIFVRDVGLLLDRHHCDRGVDLGWQRYLNLVFVTIGATASNEYS